MKLETNESEDFIGFQGDRTHEARDVSNPSWAFARGFCGGFSLGVPVPNPKKVGPQAFRLWTSLFAGIS